jgi:probable sporulation protein (polysaccharide deacetylase family)
MFIKTLKMSKTFLAIGTFLVILTLAGYSHVAITKENSSKLSPIYQGNTQLKRVSFACNVFWGEEYLPVMFKAMAEENIHITFFIGGSWARKHPELVKEMALNGHELANHSFTHPHPNALTKEQNKDQIRKTEELIYAITEQKTMLYAPPYGEFNQTVLQAADELGYKTIMWTADTIDWQRPPADVIKARVLKKVQNGAIILMHPTEPTAEALPSLMKELKQQGYEIVPVSQIVQEPQALQ